MWLNLYGWETVRHKLKNRQKMHFLFFRLFLSLRQTAYWPYRLSHINALLTQGPIHEFFTKIFWELAVLKISVFLSRPFWNFFCKIPGMPILLQQSVHDNIQLFRIFKFLSWWNWIPFKFFLSCLFMIDLWTFPIQIPSTEI